MATRRISKTQVRGKTTVEVSDQAGLTHEEEMVVRMRTGRSLPDSAPLPRRDGGHAELRARLALIEATLLEDLYGTGPLAETEAAAPAEVEVDRGLKARILAKLSRVDD